MSVSKNFCSAHDEISSEITLVWKITNISYCVIPKGQKLGSPKFMFRTSCNDKIVHEWQLFFYPQGNKTTSVTECAMESGYSRYSGKLDCHLCVCNSKELLLYSQYTELKFSEGYIVSNNLASFGREIFEKLSDDAIVLHCHIGKLASDKREGIVNLLAETRFSVRRTIFYWKVENFRSLQLEEENRHDWLIYPALGASANYYFMNMTSKLFLSGTDLKDATVQIWLTLDLKEETFCSCAVFLMDENEKIVTYIEKESLLGSIQNIMKFSFQRQEISCLLCSDSLILRAEVNLSGDNGSMDQVVYGMETIEAIAAAKRSGFPDLSTDSVPSLPASSENCPSALSTDMLSLFKGEGLSPDFELHVAGRSFSVHRAVLGARSTVFREYFTCDMSRNSLVLTDEDVDTAERMLLYAYTDKEPSPELDWDSLSNLYRGADKYALLGLRKICGDRLSRGLDVDNAPRLLLIADRHSDPLLKKKVVDYIIGKGPIVFESENWKKLVQEDPKLVVDVMLQVIKEKWV